MKNQETQFLWPFVDSEPRNPILDLKTQGHHAPYSSSFEFLVFVAVAYPPLKIADFRLSTLELSDDPAMASRTESSAIVPFLGPVGTGKAG